MSTHIDVIIAGLGAMGSATAAHLARKGRRVLGLDQFHPPHDRGSSHGQTRAIREAYFEDPVYVPMVQRAYDLWAELEALTGQKLLLPTGGLMIGRTDGALFKGALESARTYGLQHEILDHRDIEKRFPALRPPDTMSGVWEPRAGILFPEKAVQAHLDVAQQQGAQLKFNTPITGWEPDGDGVRVTTRDDTFHAGQLVITAGSWLPQLWSAGRSLLRVERQVLFWFDPDNAASHDAETCPIHLWEYEKDRLFYGFPNTGHGVKIAHHYQGEQTTPDTVNREVSPEEVSAMSAAVAPFLPGLGHRFREAAVCLYTCTADGHFIMDRHPDHSQIWIVSPCSGHGFKFSPVIGEIMAQRISGEEVPYDLGLFGLDRLRS